MKALFSALASVFVIAAMAQASFALSVPSGQRNINMVAEIGGSSEAYIVLQDVGASTELTASGEMSAWVSFDGNPSYVVHPSLTGIVPIRVSVPSDAGIGRYGISIDAGGDSVAMLTVTTTLKQDAIRILQSLADVNTRIDVLGSRLDDINRKVNSTEGTIKMLTESQQKELGVIKNGTRALADNIEELKTKSGQGGAAITGSVIGGVQLSFAAGFIAGGVLIFIFSRGARLKRFGGGG